MAGASVVLGAGHGARLRLLRRADQPHFRAAGVLCSVRDFMKALRLIVIGVVIVMFGAAALTLARVQALC